MRLRFSLVVVVAPQVGVLFALGEVMDASSSFLGNWRDYAAETVAEVPPN
jgi:hypothetical protein